VTPNAKKITAVLLLAVLALPTGLCSLYCTPYGLSGMFSRDALTQSIAMLTLASSAVGWAICAGAIWSAIRLTRAARLENPPQDPSP
jgi:hypothetical protein